MAALSRKVISSAVFYKARVAIDELKMHGVPGRLPAQARHDRHRRHQGRRSDLADYLFARMLPVALEGMREP